MSDISKYTGRFRITGGFKDHAARRVTKKLRESLACSQCRISKLRCDKGRPCGSCIKRDGGSPCLYATHPNGEDSSRAAAEERLDRLDSMVTQLMQNQAASSILIPQPDTLPDVVVDEVEASHDAPKSDSNGLKYPTVLEDSMNSINELKLALPTIGDELEKMPAAEYSMRGSERIFASSSSYSLEQILSQYLPDRAEADHLLAAYSQGDAFIQPFLHAQQFRQQCNDFWKNPLAVSPMWLSILFSIFTMTSMAREAANLIPEQPNTTTSKPYAPQALVLYAHCVNLKNLDPSREAGAMLSMGVRLAYKMGYHRDPDVFGTFSVFEGEMRRRFWAGCKQIDMMIVFQLGLPSNILLENCDTRSPRNLLDSDFGPDSQVLPPSRPESEGTGLLWFIVKDRLVPSFSKVCQDALSLQRKSEQDVKVLGEEIRLAHNTIPPLLRVRPISECTQDSRFIVMARFYIGLLHLKSLCILHRKRMISGNAWSTLKCVEAGLSVVRLIINVYKEFGPGGQLYQVRFMFINYYMSDFLLGVIILCLYVNIHTKNGAQEALPAIGAGSEIFLLLEQAHAVCVDKASASRDARKVSLAIRLALQGKKREAVNQNPSWKHKPEPPQRRLVHSSLQLIQP